ncbi:hypothetical protein XENORESO_009229, partial [Xenotaenia resolanae]
LAAANVRQPEPNTPDKQRNPSREKTAQSRCFSSHCLRGTTRTTVSQDGEGSKKAPGQNVLICLLCANLPRGA